MKPPLRLPRISSQYSYICNNCLRRTLPISKRTTQPLLQRLYSSSSSPTNLAQAPPPPPAAGFTHLPSRRLIALTGPDSTHYLQGVITANLTSSSPPAGFYAAFLNAQGRLLNDVFIYPYTESGKGDGWLIEVDAKEVTVLAKHIRRYKLRAKFEVR
ncbi:ccr4 associated factor, partial [Cadophora sp. M221]